MISLLAASEKDRGQAESAFEKKLEMWLSSSKLVCQSYLERYTLEGESPVD